MKMPIKTKQQMMGIAYIIDVALMVCALMVVYGTINFDALGDNIEKTFARASNCFCGGGVCGNSSVQTAESVGQSVDADVNNPSIPFTGTPTGGTT